MERIMEQIREKIRILPQKRIIIAIDGSCAAGKTTLASRLEAELGATVFHMDDFFLRPEQRTPERLAEPGGNVDYERFRQEVLEPLGRGEAVCYRPYDCHSRSLKAPVTVEPHGICVIEGSYSHHPRFGEIYDLKVFLEVAPDVRRQRILARPAALQRRFFEEWIPMEQRYFEAFSIREQADLTAELSQPG